MLSGLVNRWRRSLAFRVVTTTLVAAAVLVGFGMAFLLGRVTSSLVEANAGQSIAEANVGLAAARQVVEQAGEGGPVVPSEGLADSIMNALVNTSSGPAAYEVLLLDTAGPAEAGLPERGTNLIALPSVPGQLRARVRVDGQEAWTYTELQFIDGRTEPGLVVGAPLTLNAESTYEVYYLFGYSSVQRTLDLIRSAVWLAGLVLVGLLGLLMLAIARHVVLPVRQAARTAELLRAGHLEQRLPVHGEDDLAALASSFNEMASALQTQIRQLENLSRLQQRFVSDVSHELRTPLTTVRMAAEVIYDARDDIPASLRRSSELLHDQLDRFETLLSDLLEISRFDAGAAVLVAEVVDVRGIVTSAVTAALPLAGSQGSSVSVDMPDEPCLAACDRRRIERIVRNLLSNAVEHGEGRPIEIAVGQDQDVVALSVRDRGRGLTQADMRRVFDRFWRADPSRARTIGGTGLGLSIALEDTRLHNGRLDVWGRPGQGALFRLSLPKEAGAGVNGECPLPLDPTEVTV